MKPLLILIGVVLFAGLIFGSKFIGIRNELATKREGVNAAFSQIDTDLQRRADLIPNLVETVKGYAKEETTVIQSVANARAGLLSARSPQEKIDANQKLDGAIGRLLVVVENYPNLKANANFQSLQFELAGTENRILRSRQKYNEAVQDYNTTIQLFPNNIVAGISGFTRNDAYFKTDVGKRDAPSVKF